MRTSRRNRVQLTTLFLALVAALAALPAPASAEPPFDEYYKQATERGGWLQRIGWEWAEIERAVERDVAFPTIAVIDSGIQANHEEFAFDGAIEPTSADCTSKRPRVTDAAFRRVSDTVEGHGTRVAGLAAAPANGVGIVGVSPYSTILAVKVQSDQTNGGLACALKYLAGRMDAGAVGLLVVNISLADPHPSNAGVRRGLDKLVRRGALIVAATGNQGSSVGNRLRFPARLDHVLAVGDSEGRALLPGRQLDLLAPGGQLVTPVAGASWGNPGQVATSWSTALVSGAAALVWGAHSKSSQMSAQQLAYLLRVTAGRGTWGGPSHGYGTINIGNALKRQSIPGDDELEPNDTEALASARDSLTPLSCLKACTVRGIIGTTDDAVDFWRVRRPAGRNICKRLAGKGVRSSVVRGPRGFSFVRVQATRPLTNYSLRVWVC